jgi:hypothetical protein
MEVGNNPDGGRIHWLCNPKRLQYGWPGIPAGPSNLGGRSANDTAQRKVQDHRTLRRCQPLLLQIAGEHLYHGYWIRGDESKEQAQRQLIEHLARLAKVPQGAAVLGRGLRIRRQQPLPMQTVRRNDHRHHYFPGAGGNG